MAGGGGSFSLGPLLMPVAKLGDVARAKFRKLFGKQETKVDQSMVGLESLNVKLDNLNLITKFDPNALLAAYKDTNNQRFGGIYNSADFSDGHYIPDFLFLAFDLSGCQLKNAFGIGEEDCDEAAAAHVDPNKGSSFKLSAFLFVPVEQLVQMALGVFGREYGAAASEFKKQ